VSVATARQVPVAERTWLDRVYAAVPLASVYVWLCLLYAWESHGHKTPWLFVDELQLAQLSRAVNETGHAARRGQPYTFHTLYTFVLAPFWWFHKVATAYAAIKYVGVLVMTSAVFPAYFLARLVVRKPAALFAAAATAAIPSLAYSSFLIEEPLAYPWATLCLFLIAKALATRRPRWLVAAAAASLIAPLVRGELGIVVVLYVLAAILIWWTGDAARRWRSRWSTGDWIGAVVLAIGALILASALIGSFSHSWLVATGYYRIRMFRYGLWAAEALTIGLGILPVVAGLAALWRPRSEQRTPELRAFVSVAAASIVCFGLYTAVKATYLSTVFSTRVEERNLIYVSPVLFAATALWLERPRLRVVPLAAAAVFVAAIVSNSAAYQLGLRPYSDALGLSIIQTGNRNLSLDDNGTRWVLLGAVAVTVALLLAPRFLTARRRAAAGVLVLAAGLVLAWNLAGQISAGNAANDASKATIGNYPRPLDWLDVATHGEPTLYLGQKVNPLGVWLTEFWNRSLQHVWSLDGTAIAAGAPTLTPDLHGARGKLYPDPGVPYVLADEGIDVVGQLVLHKGRWNLFRVAPPLRLAHAQTDIYTDGWAGADSAYSQYVTPAGRPGYAVVTVSRLGWRGPSDPGHVRIRVGTLVEGKDKQPAMGRVTAIRRWVVDSGKTRTFYIPTPRPPIRVDVHISPTFSPADYGQSSDTRQLGAQIGFGFSFSRPSTSS
jgi:hypothetical protein